MLTPSYVGTIAVGGSAGTPGTNTAFAKQVAIPGDSVLTSIEAYLLLTDGQEPSFRVGVWDDNGGAPGLLRCLPMPPTNAVVTGGSARWWGSPVHMWFPSLTTVWIGIQVFDNSGVTLAYSSGTGSDRTITTGGVWTGEAGASGVSISNTGNDYSIRGRVIT